MAVQAQVEQGVRLFAVNALGYAGIRFVTAMVWNKVTGEHTQRLPHVSECIVIGGLSAISDANFRQMRKQIRNLELRCLQLQRKFDFACNWAGQEIQPQVEHMKAQMAHGSQDR